MTVAELIAALAELPSDMDVEVDNLFSNEPPRRIESVGVDHSYTAGPKVILAI